MPKPQWHPPWKLFRVTINHFNFSKFTQHDAHTVGEVWVGYVLCLFNCSLFCLVGHQRSPWLGEVHRCRAWESVVCHRLC